MFRFICELCRLCESDRNKSKVQLARLLGCAEPGTIAFIADINPRRGSNAQPERVSSFIESVFTAKRWEHIGFSENLWKGQSRSLSFSNIWDVDVCIPSGP